MGGSAEVAEEDRRKNVACAKCGRRGDAFRMLLCDGEGCERAEHIYCCDPPLIVAPVGEWFCSACRVRRQATEGMTGRQQVRYLQELAATEAGDGGA